MKKIPAIVIGILLFAGFALAYPYYIDYSGSAEGDEIGDPAVVPFTTWEGTITDYETAQDVFHGHWGGETNEDEREIYAEVDWVGGAGAHWEVDESTAWWEFGDEIVGSWDGVFFPVQPSPPYNAAWGTWWTIGHFEEGTWWGDLD